MSAASDNLRSNQQQLDMDGCMVGVSRQAVEETLEQYDAMLNALHLARPYIEEGWKGFGDPDREGAALKAIDAALTKVEGRTP